MSFLGEARVKSSTTMATYRDRHLIIKTNFWRDFYPPVLDYQIKRAKLDQSLYLDYQPGALLQEEFSQSNLKTIPIRGCVEEPPKVTNLEFLIYNID